MPFKWYSPGESDGPVEPEGLDSDVGYARDRILKTFPELRREFHRQRMAFIRTEIETGLTFLNVARTEKSIGNAARAERNVALAEEAYGEALRRFKESERTEMPAEFDAAEEGLSELDAALRKFQNEQSAGA